MDELELKPCPFCGEKAELREWADTYKIRCTNPHCRGSVRRMKNKAEAIRAWNRRDGDD